MSQQMQAPQDVPVVFPAERRPGLVTFAAVMLYVLACFYAVAAMTEWGNSVWLYQREFSVAGSRMIFWGFIDFGLALLSAYGGYLLWGGRRAGQTLGFVFAAVSFVRWMFYIPANPWLALAILVVDGLVIYGLASNDEWFATRRA